MMKKIWMNAALILFCFLTLVACGSKSAESQEDKKRFITVVNDTEQVINKLTISIDGGTEIKSVDNLDKKSIHILIPEEYSEHSKFTVTLVDRYDGVYEKRKTIKKTTGRHEVVVTKEDMIEEGDVISRKLNGD